MNGTDVQTSDDVPLIRVDETSVVKVLELVKEEDEDKDAEAKNGPDLTSYADLGDVTVVLKTLQSLCDLEFTRAQNLMREQSGNVKSVNVLAEICYLLSLVYTDMEPERIDLISDLLETVVEFVQGNPANQVVVFDNKVIDYINHMLRIEDFPGCNLDQILQLKAAIATVVRFMTEENHPEPENTHLTGAFLMALNEEGLWQGAMDGFRRAQPTAPGDKDQKALALDTGFTYFFILRRSIDLGLSSNSAYEPAGAWKFFSERAMSIEFQKNHTLQKLYFRFSDQKALRSEVEEKLKWEVDRSSYGNKMRDFMNWIKDIHEDILAQRKIHSSLLGLFFVRQWKVFNYTILLSTLILNVMMLATWDESIHRVDPTEDKLIYHHPEYDVLWRAFGVLHNFATFCLVTSYFLSNAAGFKASWRRFLQRFAIILGKLKRLRKRRRRKTGEEEEEKEAGEEDDDKPPTLGRKSKLQVDFYGSQVIYYVIYLAFSIMGTVMTPAFFAFHLFQIVHNNQLLARVIRAVTLNGRSLLYVAILGLVIIYLFGLIAFIALRDVYQGNLHFCESLYKCTLSTIREGLLYKLTRIDYPVKRTWGLNAAGDPWALKDNENFTYYSFKMLWDICYWVLVLTIGLNVIFGIIVDTFRQLRDAKWRIEQDIESYCFICSRSSYEFEQKGISFRYHCNVEHCIIHYVFFFARLDDLPGEELSSLEMFLLRASRNDDFSFFPLNKAMSLMDKDKEASKEQERELVIINLLHEIMGHIKEEKEVQAKNRRVAEQEAWVHQLGQEILIRKSSKGSKTSRQSSKSNSQGTKSTSLPGSVSHSPDREVRMSAESSGSGRFRPKHRRAFKRD